MPWLRRFESLKKTAMLCWKNRHLFLTVIADGSADDSENDNCNDGPKPPFFVNRGFHRNPHPTDVAREIMK